MPELPEVEALRRALDRASLAFSSVDTVPLCALPDCAPSAPTACLRHPLPRALMPCPPVSMDRYHAISSAVMPCKIDAAASVSLTPAGMGTNASAVPPVPLLRLGKHSTTDSSARCPHALSGGHFPRPPPAPPAPPAGSTKACAASAIASTTSMKNHPAPAARPSHQVIGFWGGARAVLDELHDFALAASLDALMAGWYSAMHTRM